MPQIRQLPPTVVNKIAAGEVVERPASVVKELVENALDAGARRIDVAVERGGVDLIRITDDGCGISADELPLALSSHATSKIRDADDLFRVSTLGFRGEALASIASVSRFLLRSRLQGAESAAEIEVVGGNTEQVRPAAGPTGTTVEVRNLFFNTPVRQKFLRTTQTEMGHVSDAVARTAMAHPQVAFTLRHSGRTLWELPPGSPRQRVETLFGADLAQSLIEIGSEEGELRLEGYVANPSSSRANNRMQYLFLNGRFIRDRSLQHALGEAYRGLLLTGRYPICFLHLSMPPAEVDVNVHPCKLEVRFQDGGRVYSQLLGTLRTKFLSTDLVARATLDRSSDADEAAVASQASQLMEWARAQTGGSGEDRFAERDGDEATHGQALQFHRIDRSAYGPPSGQVAGADDDRSQAQPLGPTPTDDGRSAVPPGAIGAAGGSDHVTAMQIHNRYLVTETDDGLVVIDQHALHERILYEALREKVCAGALESQRLLVPEPVDLPAAEAAVLLENQDLLARLGVEVESFGGETVLISAYPAMLANLAPAEVLRSLVEPLTTPGKQLEQRDLVDDLLHMIACKAAVKYGDRLTPSEIEALLTHRQLAQDHHHCPHGRPTALIFTREQLDRQFKRV